MRERETRRPVVLVFVGSGHADAARIAEHLAAHMDGEVFIHPMTPIPRWVGGPRAEKFDLQFTKRGRNPKQHNS